MRWLMAKLLKVIQGKRAKINGDFFENQLHREALNRGYSVIKIPSGCKSLGLGKLIRVATPFDFVFTKSSRVIFIDAKTTKTNTFTNSKVTPHQLSALYEQEKQGICAGYIVHFQNTNKIVFFSATRLKSLSLGQGLKQDDGVLLGIDFKINLDLIFNSEKSV